MWRKPEETESPNAIHPPPPPFWSYSIQCAAVGKEPPNKYRNWDIYQTPHPRQPSNSDMRTDECSVCVHAYVWEQTLSSSYISCMSDDWRQSRHACLLMRPAYVSENEQRLKGWHCSSSSADMRPAVTRQRQRKGRPGFSPQPLPPCSTLGWNHFKSSGQQSKVILTADLTDRIGSWIDGFMSVNVA